jgi:hypothetical protein
VRVYNRTRMMSVPTCGADNPAQPKFVDNSAVLTRLAVLPRVELVPNLLELAMAALFLPT